MAYTERSLGDFLASRQAASDVLMDSGSKKQLLSFDESLAMQAASHLLLNNETFYGLQIARLTGLLRGTAYPILHRFEQRYLLLDSVTEVIDKRKEGRVNRRLYNATPLGKTVFGTFQPGGPASLGNSGYL